MRRNRRIKILATLGPASGTVEKIEQLFHAGADVFRINMSHASHALMRELVASIREVEAKVGRPIGILADLQGPKLRVGTFTSGPIELAQGQNFVLDDDPTPGTKDRVHLPHPEILSSVEPGHRLLLDDGKVQLKCVANEGGKRIVTTVVVPGRLSDRKGVSLPDTTLPIGALTDKDRADLVAALDAQVDWIALSFVQRPDDLIEVREIANGRAGVLAKIEKPQAFTCLPEIIDASDAIMVARGDLGVEMPIAKVPGLQKQLIRACRKAGKPIVVATQMLESMITAPVPTRAEVSDVSIAVFEGADAIMLSAESASGKFPIEAVEMMHSIAIEVESDPTYPGIISAQRSEPDRTPADAVAAAARQISETLKLSAIVCFTQSGSTGTRASRERPLRPLIGLTPEIHMARRMALVWGLHPVCTEDAKDVDDMVHRATTVALQEGYSKPEDKIIIVAGVPFGSAGSTNLLRIADV